MEPLGLGADTGDSSAGVEERNDMEQRQHDGITTVRLRDLLDSDVAAKFRTDSIVDIPVPMAQLERRLAAMQRGLVAHSVLCEALARLEPHTQSPASLSAAIKKAELHQLLTGTEANWLRWFNETANNAKHVFDAAQAE